MNGIVVTTKGEIYHREFQEPLHRSAGEVVGGHIEFVRPSRLGKPYCMIVNEEFLLQGLPVNPVGCYLYATDEHGHPICGNIIIMKEHGEDIINLDPAELRLICGYMKMIKEAAAIYHKENHHGKEK